MKFSHSQRIFHDIKYSPPSNYYNPESKNTLSILKNETKNTFGFQKRFQNCITNSTLGPGEYFMSKKQLIYNLKQDLSNPKKFLKSTFRCSDQSPSIPYKILSEQNLNDQDKDFLKELSLIENPARAAEKTRKKEPSYSFTKSPRNLISQNNAKKQQKSKSTITRDPLQSQLTRIEQATIFENSLNPKKTQKKKKLLEVNQAIKRSSKKRNEIINRIESDFVPSLELIDLMGKMRTKYVPGPGFCGSDRYKSIGQTIKKINEQSKKGLMLSAVKRFDSAQKNLLGPGSYNINYDSLSKKGGLMAKQKRSFLDMKQTNDIEYRFYINPDSSSKTSLNEILQRSNSCASFRKQSYSQTDDSANGFGSSSKRFGTLNTSIEDIRKSQISEYELSRKNQFKVQLKKRLKRLNTNFASAKQDSGLLGISTMASLID